VLIEHILQQKGRTVVTIAAEEPVEQAVATLQQHNIGAIVVAGEDGGVVGIISERDVVRALASDGAVSLGRAVGELMSRDVTTCSSRASVDELMKVMTEQRIRHIPVMDGESLVGIVSIGDVVKSRIGELEDEAETLHDYLSSGRT
jgi:CBS domain-containing protein